METTIVYWGLYGINGKENGDHYSIIYVSLENPDKAIET